MTDPTIESVGCEYRSAKKISDETQLIIWKAALVLCDGRERWPRALTAAIAMIDERDRELKRLRQRRGK